MISARGRARWLRGPLAGGAPATAASVARAASSRPEACFSARWGRGADQGDLHAASAVEVASRFPVMAEKRSNPRSCDGRMLMVSGTRSIAQERPMSSTAQPSPPVQAPSQMLGMLNGFLIVQAMHVAAVLGIADLLASGSQSVPDLTAATGRSPSRTAPATSRTRPSSCSAVADSFTGSGWRVAAGVGTAGGLAMGPAPPTAGRGPRQVPRSPRRGPLRRSQRPGPRPTTPARSTCNCTASPPRTSPPSPPGRFRRGRM